MVPVGDDVSLTTPLQRLAHETQSRRFVALSVDMAFKHRALVIDWVPVVNHPAVDLDEHLIQVLAQQAKTLHAIDPLAPDFAPKQ